MNAERLEETPSAPPFLTIWRSWVPAFAGMTLKLDDNRQKPIEYGP